MKSVGAEKAHHRAEVLRSDGVVVVVRRSGGQNLGKPCRYGGGTRSCGIPKGPQYVRNLSPARSASAPADALAGVRITLAVKSPISKC